MDRRRRIALAGRSVRLALADVAADLSGLRTRRLPHFLVVCVRPSPPGKWPANTREMGVGGDYGIDGSAGHPARELGREPLPGVSRRLARSACRIRPALPRPRNLGISRSIRLGL